MPALMVNIPFHFDHLLGSVDEEAITILVDVSYIASLEEGVGCEGSRGGLARRTIFDITLHEIGTANEKLATFAPWCICDGSNVN